MARKRVPSDESIQQCIRLTATTWERHRVNQFNCVERADPRQDPTGTLVYCEPTDKGVRVSINPGRSGALDFVTLGVVTDVAMGERL